MTTREPFKFSTALLCVIIALSAISSFADSAHR